MNSVVAEKKFIQERLGIPYENLSQSYLRADSLLPTTAVSLVPFYLQRGQVATPLGVENLLELNDQFIITHFRVGIRVVSNTLAADLNSNSAVLTYPNPLAFGVTSTSLLQTLYNGNLSFTIDRKQFLPSFPMNAFYRVPITQQGTQSFQAVSATTTTGVDAYDNGLFGFYVSEPTLIDGRQTLDISINLPNGTAFAVPSGTRFYAVFETRGYLVVNAKS